MAAKQQRMRRTLFGVRASEVERLVVDRELTARAATDQVKAAQEQAEAEAARAAALEAQLTQAVREQQRLEAQLSERPESGSRSPAPPLEMIREEMGRVMQAAQEVGARILDRTKDEVEHQLEAVDRRRKETEAERERIAVWVNDARDAAEHLRDRLGGTIEVLGHSLETMRKAVVSAEAAMADASVELGKMQALQNRFPEPPADPTRGGAAASEEPAPSADGAPTSEVPAPSADDAPTTPPAVIEAPEPPVSLAPPSPVDATEEAPPNGGAFFSDERASGMPEPNEHPGNGSGSESSPVAAWAAGPARSK